MARPMPRLAPVIMATLFMNIDGKVALITGSAKRIGRAIAIELARRGARIAVHYRSEPREAEQTLEMIRNVGSDGAAFRTELTDNGAIAQMFQQITQIFGGLDILINSASVFSPA